MTGKVLVKSGLHRVSEAVSGTTPVIIGRYSTTITCLDTTTGLLLQSNSESRQLDVDVPWGHAAKCVIANKVRTRPPIAVDDTAPPVDRDYDQPSAGPALINAVQYIPAAHETGTVRLAYTITDDRGGSDGAAITLLLRECA